MVAGELGVLETATPEREPDERVGGVERERLSGGRERQRGDGRDDVDVGLEPQARGGGAARERRADSDGTRFRALESELDGRSRARQVGARSGAC